MASVTFTWTPTTENSSGQNLEYRLQATGGNPPVAWTPFAGNPLPPDASSQTVDGLLENRIYEAQVTTVCPTGGLAYHTVVRRAALTCPVVTLFPFSNSLGYSFAHVGGDVTKYRVDLISNIGRFYKHKQH